MNNDDKLDVRPPLHIGAQIEVTDPYMKQNAARTLELVQELKGIIAMVEKHKHELDTLREAFWGRLVEIMPETERLKMVTTGDFKHVVITGKLGEGEFNFGMEPGTFIVKGRQ